jgi:hypothetical protein
MFYYSLDGYTQLATVFPELLNSQICDISVVASDNQTYVPGSVDKDQTLYYQIPASISDGLTLKLDIHEGAATVFASLTARHPSLSDHDFSANATTENLGQIYISPDRLQQASDNSNMFFVSDMVTLGKADITVYTSVVGISDTTTNFTLHYEKNDTEVTTVVPTTKSPTTIAPTTEAPTTMAPKTMIPSTVAPTTEESSGASKTVEPFSTTSTPTPAPTSIPTTPTLPTLPTTTTSSSPKLLMPSFLAIFVSVLLFSLN